MTSENVWKNSGCYPKDEKFSRNDRTFSGRLILKEEDENVPFKGVLKPGNGGQVFSNELF